MAPHPGARLLTSKLGQVAEDSASASPFFTKYSRTLWLSFMWTVTNLSSFMVQPHSAGAGNGNPGLQVFDPGARTDMPELWMIKTPWPSMLITPRTPSPRSGLVKVPRSHWPDVTLSVMQSVEAGFPIHQPPHAANCGGSVGTMKVPKLYRVSGRGGIEQFSKPKVSMEESCPSADCPPKTRRPGGGGGSVDFPAQLFHINRQLRRRYLRSEELRS